MNESVEMKVKSFCDREGFVFRSISPDKERFTYINPFIITEGYSFTQDFVRNLP